MHISPTQAAKLLELLRGAPLKRSEINRSLREDLINRGAIRLQRSGPGYRIFADPKKLESVLENHYSIRDLDSFVQLRDGQDRSRAELTRITGNSKTLPVAPMRGLYFGVLGGAEILVKGKPATPPAGTALFIPVSRLRDLSITPMSILGVENVEAFLNAERLNLQIPSAAVTVLRWNWGNEWRTWIAEHTPEFAYAGDYDWAGVSIFENEVLPYSPRAQFLIPEDLEERLADGNPSLFNSQEDKYLDYKPRSAQGACIYKAIKFARRVLEQEALIKL